MGQQQPVDLDRRLKETINYQSEMLHYGMYTAGYNRPFQADIPWHWHEEFEMGYVTGGSVLYKTNRTSYLLHEGDAIFINSGVLHYLQSQEPKRETRMQIQFFDSTFLAGTAGSLLDVKYIAPVAESEQLDAIPFFMGDPGSRLFLELIQQGPALLEERKPFFEMRMRTLFSDLWEEVYSRAMTLQGLREKSSRTAEDERMKRMMGYIQEHFREKLTVRSIAESIPISERECFRLFQNSIGITPAEYLLSVRLENAQVLLKNTDRSILDIALETGFGTSSYFGKIFRKHHRLTPLQYRKLGQEK